jgi:hypothetical protein
MDKMSHWEWQYDFLGNFDIYLPGSSYRGRGNRALLHARKLCRDIDSSIGHLGRKTSEVGEKRRCLDQVKFAEQEIAFIRNLYIEMRKRGYKHYPDLTA